ncbi:MAG: hypothetical protein U0Q12_13885 [Vicinamibacterales bacterium]
MSTNRFRGWSPAMVLCMAAAVASAAHVTASGERSGLSQPPQLLSQTGLYSDVKRLVVDPRNRSYSPQYPLWTDGASKRRWVQLPPGQSIDARHIDAWEFPVGTRLWKEFSFGGRRVETRMLMKASTARWELASYVWNATGTDATRVPASGMPAAVEVAPGTWHAIPSVDECRACHDSNGTEPLGFTALQLSEDRDPLAVHAEPFNDGDITFGRLLGEELVRNVAPDYRESAPRIPATSPRERAVLGYLSANCGACHNTVGPLASLGLSFRQPAFGGGLDIVRAGLAKRTSWDRPGAPPDTTRVVDPGAPESSALLVRMASRRPASRMPPLGSVVADRQALEMVSAWMREELLRAPPSSQAHELTNNH